MFKLLILRRNIYFLMWRLTSQFIGRKEDITSSAPIDYVVHWSNLAHFLMLFVSGGTLSNLVYRLTKRGIRQVCILILKILIVTFITLINFQSSLNPVARFQAMNGLLVRRILLHWNWISYYKLTWWIWNRSQDTNHYMKCLAFSNVSTRNLFA